MVWRDGNMVPFAEATVHVLSHAAHRGSEVFDVLRVVKTDNGPAALGLRRHVARFDRSMQTMGMETPYDLGTIEQAVAETVAANTDVVYVKLIAAWAEVALSTKPVSRRPAVMVAAVPADDGDVVLHEPARILTGSMPKTPASILPPSLKVAAGYTAAVRQQLDAFEAGYDDVIFKSMTGRLAEATTQSLLAVHGDKIIGPPFDTVLDGITRRLLLDLALLHDLTVEVRDVFWDEVTSADELILTSTSHLVRPVGELDARRLDAPGKVALQLADDLEIVIAGRHELSDRWLTVL